MEIYRTVQLYTNKLPPPTFGKLVKHDEVLHGKFQAQAYPGSRKSRLQQTLQRDIDYQKNITKTWRTKGSFIETDSKGEKSPKSIGKSYRLKSTSLNKNNNEMTKSMYNPGLSIDKKKHFNKSFNGKERLESINKPATCEITRMHTMTDDYATREYEMTMDIDEMREILEEKRNMHWRLVKDINAATFHFKGIQDTCQSIDKFSESAYFTKKNAEKTKKEAIKADEEIRKLQDQKENIQKLIDEEKAEVDLQSQQWLQAKIVRREIKKTRDDHDSELRLIENHQSAMEIRTKKADKYEEMMENRANVRRKLNTRLHKFIAE